LESYIWKPNSLHKEYEDFDQAEKDLEDLKINRYKLKHNQFVGEKHYYKCEKNCPVRMFLKLDQESSKCFSHVTIIGLAIKNDTGRKSKKMKKTAKKK
jgi:hypothetical protein